MMSQTILQIVSMMVEWGEQPGLYLVLFVAMTVTMLTVVLGWIQARGRRVPAVVWMFGPLLVLTTGLLFVWLGIYTVPQAIATAPVEAKSVVMLAGSGLVMSQVVRAWLLAGVNTLGTALILLLALWMDSRSTEEEDPGGPDRRAAGRATASWMIVFSSISAVFVGLFFLRRQMFFVLATMSSTSAPLAVMEEQQAASTQTLWWVGGCSLLIAGLTMAVLVGPRLSQLFRPRTLVSALAVAPLLLPATFLQVSVESLYGWVTESFRQEFLFPVTHGDAAVRGTLPTIQTMDGASPPEKRSILKSFSDETTFRGQPVDGRVSEGRVPAILALLSAEKQAAEEFSALLEGLSQFEGNLNLLADRHATWTTLKPLLLTLDQATFRSIGWVVSHPEQDASIEVVLTREPQDQVLSPHILFTKTGWTVDTGSNVVEVSALPELARVVQSHRAVRLRPESDVTLQQIVEVVQAVSAVQSGPKVMLQL